MTGIILLISVPMLLIAGPALITLILEALLKNNDEIEE